MVVRIVVYFYYVALGERFSYLSLNFVFACKDFCSRFGILSLIKRQANVEALRMQPTYSGADNRKRMILRTVIQYYNHRNSRNLDLAENQ